MSLLFLGTGAMVPTKQRNVSSVLLEYEGRFFLFDCGEGTQRQMNLAGYNRTKVSHILLTHWHGDHVSGLIGLIQTIGNIPEPGSVTIAGPAQTKQRVEHLMNSAIFDKRLSLDIVEADPEGSETVVDEEAFSILAAPMEHRVPTIAFAFVEKDKRRFDMDLCGRMGIKPGPLMGKLQREGKVEVDGKVVSLEQVTYVQKGRKIAYVMDTRLTPSAVQLSEDADVLICESTFLAEEHQDKAEAYNHLSARDAASIARDANVRQLVLTHFSQRYLDVGPLLEEAQAVFPNTITAHDFLELEVERT